MNATEIEKNIEYLKIVENVINNKYKLPKNNDIIFVLNMPGHYVEITWKQIPNKKVLVKLRELIKVEIELIRQGEALLKIIEDKKNEN